MLARRCTCTNVFSVDMCVINMNVVPAISNRAHKRTPTEARSGFLTDSVEERE